MERKTTSPTAKRAVAAAFAGALALSFGGLTVVPNDAASQLLAAPSSVSGAWGDLPLQGGDGGSNGNNSGGGGGTGGSSGDGGGGAGAGTGGSGTGGGGTGGGGAGGTGAGG
ncbi:hypothetical protein H7J88_00020, partial [Mycolicibacterium flavescens]